MFKFINLLILVGLSGLILSGCSREPNPSPIAQIQEAAAVPLIREEDIIGTFFNLINEQRPEEAMTMMTSVMLGDKLSQQTWLEQFQAFSFVEVNKVEPSFEEDWTDNRHIYRVLLNVVVVKGENLPIPYYGWVENPNVRWVNLLKNDQDIWQISAIATGP